MEVIAAIEATWYVVLDILQNLTIFKNQISIFLNLDNCSTDVLIDDCNLNFLINNSVSGPDSTKGIWGAIFIMEDAYVGNSSYTSVEDNFYLDLIASWNYYLFSQRICHAGCVSLTWSPFFLVWSLNLNTSRTNEWHFEISSYSNLEISVVFGIPSRFWYFSCRNWECISLLSWLCIDKSRGFLNNWNSCEFLSTKVISELRIGKFLQWAEPELNSV
jgi:hypothetical protein